MAQHTATLAQQIKAPNDNNREQRVLWLVLVTPEGRKRARVLDVVIGAELPPQYVELVRLPKILTHAAGYNAWLTYRELQLDGEPADENADADAA
jgi:hypothetical protein